MMKRLLLVPVLLALLLVPVFGCDSPQAAETTTTAAQTTFTGEFSQAELSGILADAVQTVHDADSYKSDLDADIDMEIAGGPDAGEMNMEMEMQVVTDQAGMDSMYTYTISMSGDASMGITPEMSGMTMEMYLIDDELYVNMELPGIGQQWINMPATPDMMAAYDLNMMESQLETLSSVVGLSFLRYETIDGEECYVLKVEPDMAEIMSWAGQDVPAEMGDLTDAELEDMFDELSYTVWVGKDSSEMKKLTAFFRMNMNESMFDGAADAGFDTMVMEMDMTMSVYDYNVPVSITLPEEVEGAMEISPDAFLGQ